MANRFDQLDDLLTKLEKSVNDGVDDEPNTARTSLLEQKNGMPLR